MFSLNDSNVCNNCLMPEPFARLNDDKVCRECVNYKTPVLEGLTALKRHVEIKTDKADYDCMVAISGGRDGIYALYVAKKLLNLKVLAFNYNNEFVHEQAVANMKNACMNLGVDFIRVVSKRRMCHKIVADQLRIATPFGPGTLEKHLCGPCSVGGALAIKRTAMEKNIPIVIVGNSGAEKLPEYLKIGTFIPLKKKLANKTVPYFLRAQFNKFLHRQEFSSSFKEIMDFRFAPRNDDPESQNQRLRGIKILPIYSHIKWDRHKIVSTIEKELGWRKPEDHASSWRFDCRIGHLIDYLWFKACGYPKRFFGYVQMIRDGTMTKEEALEQLNATNWGRFTPQMEELLLGDLRVERKYVEMIRSY